MAKKDDEPGASGLDYTQAKIRLPASLREALGEKAKQNSNTLNAEIVSRLQSSLAADQSLGDPEMIAFWADLKKEIDYAEQATGKKWRADAATYTAAHALVVAQLKRFRPPLENQKEIYAASDELKKKEDSLNTRLELLERCGVIRKPVQNAFAGLVTPKLARGIFGTARRAADFDPTLIPKAYEDEQSNSISAAVISSGYVLNVDIDAKATSWEITDEDGNKATENDAIGMKAVLNSIPKAGNDMREARQVFLDAFKSHKEAEAMGVAIAKDKLQGPTLGDLASAEGEAWLSSSPS